VHKKTNTVNIENACKHKNDFFDFTTNESVCVGCGMILIDVTPLDEIQTDEFFDERLLIDDFGNSSSIPAQNKDHSATYLPYYSKVLFNRLRRIDVKSKSESVAFRDGFFLLKKLGDNLGLSDGISKYAAYLYRKAYQKKIRFGGSITKLAFPAVYIACNELGSPRQISEILKNKEINRKQFFRGYKKMFLGLGMNTSFHNPIMILQRLGGNLELAEKTKREVILLLSRARKKSEFSGFNPATLVGAAIYAITLKTLHPISQSKIAKEFGITDVSLRNCYFKLRALT
jgi:transcription initiation factor TFIIIB Brf1 subunit/transcription initiation factor TFIIB